MRNILIGLTIGLSLNGLIAFANEYIVVNKPQCIAKMSGTDYLSTIKVTAPEGTYRIFIYTSYKRGGITAVRIK